MASLHCTKVAKHRIVQITPYYSPGTQVSFLMSKIQAKFQQGHQCSNTSRAGYNRRFSTNFAISQQWCKQDRHSYYETL